MRRCNQVVSILLLILSIYVIIGSRELTYTVEFSPGAGFFPFWLGISLFICSFILLLNSSILKYYTNEENPFPDKQAFLRIIFIAVSSFIGIVMFEQIGFLISMTLLVAALLVFLEKYKWYSGILIAVLMVSAIYGLFKGSLAIPLPRGVFYF